MNHDTPPPAETREILKARAHQLAQPLADQQPTAATLPVVEFLLASESYAVETACVREVYPLKEITPLPCTPPFVLGIINVRGQIVTVIDLKKFFDLPEKGITELNKVLIIRSGDIEIGILADAVTGGRLLDLHELQSSLPTLSGIRAEYLRGVSEERLIVLDVANILSDPRLIVDEAVKI